MPSRPALILLLAAALAAGPGCLAIPPGGGAPGQYSVSPPTLGHELIDLKRAHTEGALSDAEYQRLKAKLIEEGRRF